MKNLSSPLLLFFIVCMGNARAQFPNFPDSNALWLMSVWGQQGFVDQYGYHLRASNQDTLLNGTLYYSLWAGAESQGGSFAGGIREDIDGRVYYFHPNSSAEYLLYDFDPVVGESMHVWIGSPQEQEVAPVLMHITSIETLVNSNGTPYKLIGIINDIALNSGQGSDHYWVQGVGGNGGLFSTWGSNVAPLYSVYLDCMQHNDSVWPAGAPGICSPLVIPETPNRGLNVHPNPSTGPFTISGSTDIKQVLVFDPQGREVLRTRDTSLDLTAHPAGLYTAVVTTAQGRRSVRLVVQRE